MNASIDFWLDELDTQVTELSPEQVRALRSGVVPTPSREPRASNANAAGPIASKEAVDEWPTWAGLATTGVA